MKNILLIVNKLPIPYYRDGVTLINYRILQYAPLDYSFDILSITKEENDTIQTIKKSFNSINNVFDIISSEPSSFLRLVSLISFALVGRSFCITSLDKKLKTLNLDKYCLIYISTPPAPLYFSNIISKYPLFINAIDSFSLLNNRFHFYQKDIISYMKELIYKIAERKCFKKAVLVNFVSELDKEFTSNFCKTNNLISVTNGVDAEYFSPNFQNRDDCSMLFVGNFNYQPNNVAVIQFIKNIYPKVKNAYPNVILYIVGMNGNFNFDDKSIIVTGFTDDLRCYYKKATIFISPLKSGSGVKNKILEAMASGIPIISTTIGVDGINGVENNKNALISDTDEAFTNNIFQLFKDENKRFDLANSARKLIESDFSWQNKISLYYLWFKKIIEKNTMFLTI